MWALEPGLCPIHRRPRRRPLRDSPLGTRPEGKRIKARAHGRRTLALSTAVGLIGLIGAAPASAATQIGQTFAPTSTGCSGPGGSELTLLQTTSPGPSYAAPFAGVLTSWSFQAGSSPPQVKLKVGRAAGGNSFTIVGESSLRSPTPSAPNSFPIRLPVQTGDVIGIYGAYSASGDCLATNGPGFTMHQISSDPAPGTTPSFTPFSDTKISVAASLEPDCDSDGFGDETQDPDIASCTPPPDTTAPDTTITKHPNAKTRKKQATFEFTASEPGATFECSLDGKPFATCSSPDTFKVKKGKHSFEVRAHDAAGNVDSSPASDDWKVKRNKRM